MFTKINCANYKHLLYNKIAQLDLIPTVLVRMCHPDQYRQLLLWFINEPL